ncbi:MAG: ATP-binding protein [Wujia sp.]
MNFEVLKKEKIIQDLSNLRLTNKRKLQNREQEIYEKIPEIRQLKKQNKLSYLTIAKQRIDKSIITNDNVQTNRENSARIRELLLMHGYPADYLEPIYECQTCYDQGFVDGRTCRCFEKRMIMELYKQSNLTSVLNKENFDTFSLSYYNQNSENQQISAYENAKNVRNRCMDFVERFEHKKRDRGNLLLYGETGLGKTFLTNCIAKSLLDNGHSVLYLSAIDLFDHVLGDFFINKKRDLEEIYKYVYNSELLIIDDLGTELTNAFVCSQLFEIINQRGLAGKSTVISTNLSMQDLQLRYTERIMSRIVESYTVLYLYGDNIRYQKRREMIQTQHSES